MPGIILEFDRVTKQFGSTVAADALSLHIRVADQARLLPGDPVAAYLDIDGLIGTIPIVAQHHSTITPLVVDRPVKQVWPNARRQSVMSGSIPSTS